MILKIRHSQAAIKQLRLLFAAIGLMFCSFAAQALTQAQALAISVGENDDRVAALTQALATPDPALSRLIDALLDDTAKVVSGKVLIVTSDKTTDAATGQETTAPDNAEDIVNNNRLRRELESAKAALGLFSDNVETRTAAITELRASADEKKLPLIDRALAQESDVALQARLQQLRAAMLIASSDRNKRLEAATALASSSQPTVKSLLQGRLAAGVETDPEVRAALTTALRNIESRLAWGERLGVVFSGLSLGSILFLVALGLAICYGLMGVINMAHGELMMIGAYATYVVQNAFRQHFPAAFDYYILAAIPVAFAVSALVGAALERTVIRWLYGRPLETLLATWGISLMLIQLMRTIFGAQNVPVENPSWLSGGWEVLSNLTLPYNRIAIVFFAFMVLILVYVLINKTRLGLFVRGVTQNRTMASCMGVNTARIDMYAFALGSGIAGLAGCALSQIGNVGPDLGQGYIVDSFMVVVLGGVGQLAGTVYAGLGLGVLNKLLEGWTGAVLAKIIVLVFIVVFIQRRPQGIFALKGRSAES
ncbi:MAG: urea ABC transporter permease subunit UrtB [Betaproteobacteria bacterium]|nr:MAG: urea ABC transporter permease subunit UrtB [Betaproteobacteria bacterium]